MDGGFLFIILMVVVGGILFSVHQSKQLNAAWSLAAQRLGLLYEPGGFARNRRMRGKMDDCFMMVETFTRGSGKNSSKYTRYHVTYPQSLELGLSIKKQGFFGGMAKSFGAQDIEVGDPGFDNLALVKGRDTGQVRDFLSEGRRRWVRQLLGDFRDVEFHDTGIRVESRGQESSTPVLVRNVHLLVDAAKGMCDQDAGAENRRPGSPIVRQVVPPVPALRRSIPPDLPKPPPLPVGEPEPVETPVPETNREVEEPPSAVEFEAPEEAAEPADERGAEVTAAEVGASLFGGNRGSSDIEKSFVSDFADRTVTGKGTLRHWRKASYDFVFGGGSYIMATVEIPRSHAEGGEHHPFDVCLKLPADTPKQDIGDKVEFQGRLVKVDGLMRRIYVAS